MSSPSRKPIVLEAQREGVWVYLCPACPRPRTKTDDPPVPALVLSDDTWACPTCGSAVSDDDLWRKL